MSDRGSDGKNGRLPDSIDQRLDTCTDHLYGGLIGLVMGFWGAVASIWFVSVALISPQPAGRAARPDRGGREPDDRVALRPGVAGRIDLVPGDYGTALLAGRPRGALRPGRHPLRLERRPHRPDAAPSSGSAAMARGAASSPRC